LHLNTFLFYQLSSQVFIYQKSQILFVGQPHQYNFFNSKKSYIKDQSVTSNVCFDASNLSRNSLVLFYWFCRSCQ